MNGVYSNTLRIAKIEKKKVSLLRERQFHMYIHSTKNAAGLCRLIFLLIIIIINLHLYSAIPTESSKAHLQEWNSKNNV